MTERWEDLPEECWDLIFNRLDNHCHFESLSLVSKRFLSITNRLRFKFTIIDPTIIVHGTISKLISRFQQIKTLDLSKFHGNLDKIIIEIALSSVLKNLESLDISNQKTVPVKLLKILGLNMKNLKVLKCSNLCLLCDTDLVAIATVLPFLEELDISYPHSDNFDSNRQLGEFTVTDAGIEALWSSLRNLRVLNISGNHFITDRSIVGLSLNCLFLREIAILDCSFITQNGIQFMLGNSRDLSVISVNGIQIPRLVRSSTYCRALYAFDISDSVISDEFLNSIAKAILPLKRLSLSCCTNFTFFGISLLLSVYQSLEHLALVEVHFLTDQFMSEVSQFLMHLVCIKLDSCSKLTGLTFVTLATNCRTLESIEMSGTNIGKQDRSMDFTKNQRIKSLNLARNSHLSNRCLKNIASVCPNLELLDISSSSGITEEAIVDVLNTCLKIRHLQITDCGGIKNLGTGMKLPKLEVLCVARSGFNNDGLMTIWKRCPGLVKLDLEGCSAVTTKNMEEVVRNCERLREINLKGCCNVNFFSVATSVVLSRLALKRIIPPSNFSITDGEKKYLLSHGCLVSDL